VSVTAGPPVGGRFLLETPALPPLRHDARVVAVLPALDEAEALPGVLAALRDAGVSEIVVVDGGSSDATADIARAAAARVVVERRRGYGRACRTGAAASDAPLIAFLDADGSDDPTFLPPLIAEVRRGAALALGARRTTERGAVLLHQRAGNVVVAGLVRLFYRAAVHDVPPMRVVRRDVLDRLAMVEDTYGWPTEMLVKTLRAGLPVVELPVVARARRGGTSKIAGRAGPSLKAGACMLNVVLRHAWSASS
jgi:glycosyltransferase involved in cell wall biosynthesis